MKKFTSLSCVILTTLWYSLYPSIVLASSGKSVIIKLQQGSFWTGIIFAFWGIYEWWFGGPNGTQRFWKAVIGYCVILLLPIFFSEIEKALTFNW